MKDNQDKKGRVKKYPADRHWTMLEITSLPSRTEWIVEFFGVKRLCRCGGYVFTNVLMVADTFYNRAWRAWPYLPSDALRNQNEWDDMPVSPYIVKLIESGVRESMKPYNELRRR